MEENQKNIYISSNKVRKKILYLIKCLTEIDTLFLELSCEPSQEKIDKIKKCIDDIDFNNDSLKKSLLTYIKEILNEGVDIDEVDVFKTDKGFIL